MCFAPRYMSGNTCTPLIDSRYDASPPATPCAKTEVLTISASNPATLLAIARTRMHAPCFRKPPDGVETSIGELLSLWPIARKRERYTRALSSHRHHAHVPT